MEAAEAEIDKKSKRVLRKYVNLDLEEERKSGDRKQTQREKCRWCISCRSSVSFSKRNVVLVVGSILLLILLVALASLFTFYYLRSQPCGSVQEMKEMEESSALVNGQLQFDKVFRRPRDDSASPPPPPLPGQNASFSFLVVGDWGRDGGFGQKRVARSMSKVASEIRPSFVISTGDNFYEGGLSGPHDQQFHNSFTDIYRHLHLQVPWLAVLGNHDYGDASCGKPAEEEDVSCLPEEKIRHRSPLHEMDKRLRERDWRWFCERFYIYRANDNVEFFFIDTNPFIEEYFNRSWAHSVDGGLSSQSIEVQKTFLSNALKASNATW